MVLSETSNGSTLSYWHGLDVLAQSDGTNTSYFEYDGLGSVRQLTDSSGVVGLAQTFDPYGNPYSLSGVATTSLGFTGEQTDSNGFVFLRARYYNPSQGRFFQTDPSRQEQNPYQYAAGNPVLFVDPLGLCSDAPNLCEAIADSFEAQYGVSMYWPGRKLTATEVDEKRQVIFNTCPSDTPDPTRPDYYYTVPTSEAMNKVTYAFLYMREALGEAQFRTLVRRTLIIFPNKNASGREDAGGETVLPKTAVSSDLYFDFMYFKYFDDVVALYQPDNPWDRTIETVLHEYGHVLGHKIGGDGGVWANFEIGFKTYGYPTGRQIKNNPSETFAESFLIYIWDHSSTASTIWPPPNRVPAVHLSDIKRSWSEPVLVWDFPPIKWVTRTQNLDDYFSSEVLPKLK